MTLGMNHQPSRVGNAVPLAFNHFFWTLANNLEILYHGMDLLYFRKIQENQNRSQQTSGQELV
jgi:hypothetical protein